MTNILEYLGRPGVDERDNFFLEVIAELKSDIKEMQERRARNPRHFSLDEDQISWPIGTVEEWNINEQKLKMDRKFKDEFVSEIYISFTVCFIEYLFLLC